MDFVRMCRVCMTKDNLTSIFSIMDGGKISDKMQFVCGVKITPSDSFPKLICHHCLSLIIIAASVKKRTLDTEKVFQDMTMTEDVEYINSDEEQYLIDDKDSLKTKYMIYEDDSETENQPKMNYHLTSSTVRVKNTNIFNYNPELKGFLEGYLENKPNLEIVKISNADCIDGIEKALRQNMNAQGSSDAKRFRAEADPVNVGVPAQRTTFMQPSSSKLLNALAGRYGNNGR